MEIATLALGCFWGPEIKFSKLDGVINTEVGYCGGNTEKTSYKEVCYGDTNHAEVEMAPWLKERYPTEITVVMQHWYDDLEVRDDGFSVTLNFGDAPEHLVIPYEAILTFVDPSVEFGLRFESSEDEDNSEEPTGFNSDEAKTEKETGQIVSLDSFRK